MKRQILILSFILITLILYIPVSYAQTGAWISQTISGNPGGNALADCGENCTGTTWQLSRYVYFFDSNNSQWTEVDLGSQQVFHDLVAEGQTIMAYSDSLLIGYSAITSQWDTVYYTGTLLDSNYSVPNRGYGCGTNLAYFVTDYAMYVFDSELGQWKKGIFSPHDPFFNGNTYWSQGDYAAAILSTSFYGKRVNMAYSQHTHNFVELVEGGFPGVSVQMTHGFVTEWDDHTTFIFNGYSALSNQFSQLVLTPPYGQITFTDAIPGDQVIEKTVFACNYIELVSDILRRSHTYGYDTRLGNWTENTFDYDPQEMMAGSVLTGGQAAVSQAYNINPNSTDYNLMTYIIYNGQSGLFSTVTPGLYMSAGIYATPMMGGTVIMAFDTSNVWFYNIENGQSQLFPLSGPYTVERFLAENYGIICSYEQPSSDSMKLSIYNGTTNHYTALTTWKTSDFWGWGTYDIFPLITGMGGNDIYFYSALVDNFTHMIFPGGSPGELLNDQLAVAYSANLSYLYDAMLNTVHTENYSFMTTTGLGSHIFAIKTDDYHVVAYSGVTHQWSDFTVPDQILGASAGAYIALVRTPSWVNKFYVYNGFHDNLVELDLAGSTTESLVGEKTALVVQNDMVYAFDPQAVTGISEPQDISSTPSSFSLSQNYPNPFNPSTKIRYEIPGQARKDNMLVTLKVYDVLGSEIATLVNEEKPAGSYDVEFDGSNLTSGVYFYQLRAGSSKGQVFVQTKKMLLIK